MHGLRLTAKTSPIIQSSMYVSLIAHEVAITGIKYAETSRKSTCIWCSHCLERKVKLHVILSDRNSWKTRVLFLNMTGDHITDRRQR
jgi:hypothetical protein